MTKNEVTIIQEHPQIINDTKLFRLALLPIELYTLKFFFKILRPTNIHECHATALDVIFFNGVVPEALNKQGLDIFRKQLFDAGYGYIAHNEKDKIKIHKEYSSLIQGYSETEREKVVYLMLRRLRVRFPSNDKIKTVFQRFESLGIIIKISGGGKAQMYTLSPNFYGLFKNKRDEILGL